MWHAEHKKVLGYVQAQGWDATLQQQAVESVELLRDLEAAGWGPALSFCQALHAAAAWPGLPAIAALLSGLLYALLGRTLSGASLVRGVFAGTLLCVPLRSVSIGMAPKGWLVLAPSSQLLSLHR